MVDVGFCFSPPSLAPVSCSSTGKARETDGSKVGRGGGCVKQVTGTGNEVKELRVIIMISCGLQDRLLIGPNVNLFFPV